MRRLLSLALLLAPLAAAAQLTPSAATAPAATPPGDEVQAAVRREVEKAKVELRDEIRAELQGQQAAKDFQEAAAGTDRRKLDFLQLQGYFRVRGALFDDMNLRRGPDPAGYYLWPGPIADPLGKGTQTTGDLRLRLEPVMNVSEQIRVLAQIDVLDGVVLGSTPSGYAASEAGGQTPPETGKNGIDRSSLRVKRAWAEVQTPVGLLSFGRMPDAWGLGISHHAGGGLDDDLGDNVDRIQLAIPVRQTFLGPIAVVPFYDVNASGLVSQNLGGVGQPIALDKADERWTLGVKAARIDGDDEVARRIAAGKSSLNYGLRYGYHRQNNHLEPTGGTPGDPSTRATADTWRIGLHYHALNLWGRYVSKKLRVEGEAALRTGTLEDGRLTYLDPSTGLPYASPVGPVNILQFGGALQVDYKPVEKLTLAGEWGFASGDSNPGMGLHPGRGYAQHAWIDGAQYDPAEASPNLTNFTFNAAYRVDQILWRDLYGAVTDAWYLKGGVRYDLLDGLAVKGSIIYSQAMYAASTPSTKHKPLGVELDGGVLYGSDDGFHAWLDAAVLQPLDGLGYGPDRNPSGLVPQPDLKRAYSLRGGLAIKF